MAYPMIGTLPISKITPQEVLAVLRKVEAESARRMRSVLSRVFRYGIATARADRDVAPICAAPLSRPRSSISLPSRRPTRLAACCARSKAIPATRSPRWRFGCHRTCSCGPANCAALNDRVRYAESSLVALGGEDENAPATSGATLAPSARYARRGPRPHGRWAIPLPLVPLTKAAHVREYRQRGATAARLQPRRNDGARLPSDGRDPAQRGLTDVNNRPMMFW